MTAQAHARETEYANPEFAWSSAAGRATLVVLAVWAVFACILYAGQARGGDLAPLAIGARLVARGLDALLYARALDGLYVGDAAWAAEAAHLGYDGAIFPYLYPPLVAHLLVPVAGIDFIWLRCGAIVADVAAILAAVVLAAWCWNRAWLKPAPLLALLAGLSLSIPFVAGAIATNVQGAVILLIVVAMAASQRGRPALAGLALAAAAFVKILPGVIALYWLAAGRRDCAGWFAGGLASLAAISVAVAGVDANLAYLANLRELANTLVPVWSNKGLPGLLYGLGADLDTTDTFRLVAIPTWISAATLAAMLGGLALVLRGARRFRSSGIADAAGMAAAFLVVTMASSIAWSHYYRFLAIAVVVWAGLGASGTRRWALPTGVAVLTSIFFKIAAEWLAGHGLPAWMIGGDLVAGLLLLAGLLLGRRGTTPNLAGRASGAPPLATAAAHRTR